MNRFRNRNRTASLILCVFATLLFTTIFLVASTDKDVTTTGDSFDSPDGQDETTPEEARNRIWTLFNADCSMDGDRTPAFDVNLCRALHPASGDEVRLQSLLALHEMNAIDFEPDDAVRLVGVLRDGPVDIRIGLMRGLNADSELGMRISGLTCDYDRMRLFLWGEEIPLE